MSRAGAARFLWITDDIMPNTVVVGEGLHPRLSFSQHRKLWMVGLRRPRRE